MNSSFSGLWQGITSVFLGDKNPHHIMGGKKTETTRKEKEAARWAV